MKENEYGIVKNNTNKFAVVYRLVDFLVFQFALVIAIYSYGVDYSREYFILTLLASLGFAFTAEAVALYRSWRSGYFKQIVFYTFICWSAALALILGYLVFSKTSTEFSRVTLAIWFCATFLLLVGWRYLIAYFLAKMRAKGFNLRNVAIIGLTPNGVRLIEQITQNPDTGFRLVAIFDDRGADRVDPAYHHLLKGDSKDGIKGAQNNDFDTVYIALPVKEEKRLKRLLFELGDTTVNVHVVPDFFMYCLMSATMAHVGNVQTISVYDDPMQGFSAALKRFEDIVLSSVILAIISIPLLFIALGIKLTSKGPILFKQDRYGLNGRRIKVWKFRSMTVSENGDKVVQATKNDARVTKFGAFLRRTSLDELPQFFNVLGGSMSVIGPRPHAVAHNEEYRKLVDYYMLRHKVKPGITGWAQINGWRGETDTIDKMEKRIEFDLEYIRNWSLWLDIKIVFLTIFKGFIDKNAY
jgi:putative colanic acid biosynthesis UDP-glucose lipid carrier transferase